jgi:MFS family permease
MTLGRGEFGALNLELLGAAAIGLGLFLRTEARVPSPLIRLAMFRDPALRAGLVASALVATVMMATLVVGPFYLSRSLGLDAALVGAVMSVGPAISALSGVPAGRLVDRWGATRATILGLGLTVAGSLGLALLPGLAGVAGYVAAIAVLTPGYQLFQAANNTAVMAEVAADRRGLVSGLLNLSRNVGLMTGASLMGAVFAIGAGSSDLVAASPEAVATGLRVTFAVATLLVVAALAVVAVRRGRPQASTGSA